MACILEKMQSLLQAVRICSLHKCRKRSIKISGLIFIEINLLQVQLKS
jgi:hypothetical protein